MPLISALRRQRHMDLYEFEASLVYKEFRDSKGYTEKPCLKKRERERQRQRERERRERNSPRKAVLAYVPKVFSQPAD